MKDYCIDETKPVARNLVTLSKKLRCSFSSLIAEELSSDLSQAEHRMVGFVCQNPGCYSIDIANEFHLVRSTVSAMVKSIQEKGYIRFGDSGKDKRKIPLFPTDLALGEQKKAEEFFRWFDAAIEEGITEEERKVFFEVCRKIDTNIKEVK